MDSVQSPEALESGEGE